MALLSKDAFETYKSLNYARVHMVRLRDSLSRGGGGTPAELGECTLIINVMQEFMHHVKKGVDAPSSLDEGTEPPACIESLEKEDLTQMAHHLRKAKNYLSNVHETNRVSGNSVPGGLNKLARVINVLDRLWVQEKEKWTAPTHHKKGQDTLMAHK